MWRRIDRKIDMWRGEEYITEFELLQFLEQNRAMLQSFHLEEAKRLIEQFLLFLSETSDKNWTESEWLPLLRQLQEEFTVEPSRENPSQPSQEKQPLLLIIDDDMEFITYMKNYLETNGYQVIVALTGRKGLELFYEVHPDLVLLDYVLPDIDGISLLTQIVEKARNEFTPIMMVSAHVSNEHKTLSYNLGVWDFIGKPINKDIFLPFLNNRLSYSRQILKQTLQDELTGAYNRKFMERELTNQLELCTEQKDYCFSLAMVDLDHFKSINDTYGHHMGDQVLERFVDVFQKLKDPDDTISRYGGEEFTILFPTTDGEEAAAKLQKWREKFSGIAFVSGNEEFHVHFSAGITETTSMSHGKEILEQADKALYHAKHSGRNRTSLYSTVLEDIEPEEELHLVVVDEDPRARKAMTDYFTTHPFVGEKPLKVKTFETGEQLLKSRWYDSETDYVLLVDMAGQRKDDIELITQIRNSYPTGNIAITILTEDVETERMEQALRADVDDYIVKPFEAEEIKTRLDVLVERMFD